MLITRKEKGEVEYYFIHFLERNDEKYRKNIYDMRMFNVIEKVIKFYGKDKEKSQFIRKYLIGRNI